ncbi:WD repeat-containing protein 6-like [Uloborus diversus]|uniref:WD repeat-containing protein 6-like n=1 Tax=Uloborus diversus TaxID=327109 RepID=UPI0024093931|nr:WD repeat-containing protein 6-like [Uloborus diversus]
MRFMDVTVRAYDASFSNDNEKYIIATACSDSLFRVYSFDAQKKCLDLCYSVQYGFHCILKLLSVEIANQPLVHYFVTGATDGELKIIYHEYKNDHSSHNSCTYNHELVFRVQLHKSGINAVDAKNIKENIWLVCCGGDDNALTAILLDFKPTLQNETQIEILSRTLVSDAHASQITGIKFLGSKMLASVSIDQRLNIWHWNLNNGKLEISLRNSAMSLIPDISQMDCWPKSSTSWNAIICGQGIEYFNIENSKSNE